MALLSYNRSLLTNEANSFVVPLTDTDQIILEFGLPVTQSQNFVELLATVGWTNLNNPPTSFRPEIAITILQDGVEVASVSQEANSDPAHPNVRMTTTLQAVLTDVPSGHHVYQLLARNVFISEGPINLTGPANISGKVIS